MTLQTAKTLHRQFLASGMLKEAAVMQERIELKEPKKIIIVSKKRSKKNGL